MPSEAELAAEGRLKVQRVRQAYDRNRDRRGIADAGNADKSSDTEAEPAKPETDAGVEVRLIGELGAVRMGPGWRGYLAAIGFEGHIRTQLRAAIGSYFYEYGSRGDRRGLRDEIEKAVKESPFLDCNEPWSRRRADALDYLEPDGNSNVDEMIRDVAAYEEAKERREEEVVEPSWPLPTNTKDEAFEQVEEAIRRVVNDARDLRQRRVGAGSDFVEVNLLFNPPPQTAVLCEPGIGKTRAMISAVVGLLRADPAVRVAVAVPTHPLGRELVFRINAAFGSVIASEWNGIDPMIQSSQAKKCAGWRMPLRSCAPRAVSYSFCVAAVTIAVPIIRSSLAPKVAVISDSNDRPSSTLLGSGLYLPRCLPRHRRSHCGVKGKLFTSISSSLTKGHGPDWSPVSTIESRLVRRSIG